MILNNFTNMALQWLGNYSGWRNSASGDTKNISGSNAVSDSSYTSLFNRGKILVGDGTNEVKATDYCLGNDITASFSAGTPNVQIQKDSDGKGYITISQTFTNNTGSDITITEYGILNYASSTYNWLFTRELFDNPITVGAGESITISAVLK